MSGTQIALYRLPIATANRVGHARAVVDRNRRLYLNGSRVEQVESSGPFSILTAADGKSYYVKTVDYHKLVGAPK
jgi:hypothetical protein